jgi:hypothetical protein
MGEILLNAVAFVPTSDRLFDAAKSREEWPVTAAATVVVVSVLVLGLNVRPVPRLKGWFEFVLDAANSGK